MLGRAAAATLVLGLAAPAAPAAASSLEFFGNGSGQIDRVKIRVDPQVPADVGGSFTIEFWMRADADDNPSTSADCGPGGDGWIEGNVVVDRDIFGPGPDFGISLANTTVVFGLSNATRGYTICGETNVLDGQWHHVAVQRKKRGGRMELWVDGTLDAAGDGPGGKVSYPDGRATGYPASDPFLVLGAEKHDAGPAYPSYTGKLDELRISKGRRYRAPFTAPIPPFSPDARTRALYHLDGAGACTGKVKDSSGAAGGPSHGRCRYGGEPAGPVYVADSPL